MTSRDSDPTTNQGIGVWIERRRIKSAGVPALIHQNASVNYDDLADRVQRLAASFTAYGVRSSDRIAYLGNNHPAFVETLFASALIGAIFVPLNTRLARQELVYQIDDSGAHVLVNAQSLESAAEDVATRTPLELRIVVDDAGTTDAEFRRATGTQTPFFGYEQFLQTSGERVEATVSTDDPALLIYTSGTTGRPKGAVLSHGNVLWNCLNVLVDYDITSSDKSLMISPLFHVASLDMGCLPTLLKGGTVIMEETFDPGRALALIESYGVTMISGVPTTYQMLCEHPDWATTDVSSLRNLTCGGSPVPTRVLEAYEQRGLSFSGGYGLTETSPGLTSLQPRYSREKAGSGGLPHFFSSMRVVDEVATDQPPYNPGEILAKGPNVIREYWHRPEETAASFTTDGWFRTGDVGYLDDDGFLYISDRIKDMIISGGENIYSAEVEEAVMQLADVKSVAVIGVSDQTWGEVPHAVIVLVEGAELDPERFRAHMVERLARYKVPKSYQIVDELPRTSSGKIQKQSLRTALPAGTIVSVRGSSGREPT